ncbi:hypothetical protein ACHAXM_009799 [Skeletonema potamos]|jgi:hypothetical protein
MCNDLYPFPFANRKPLIFSQPTILATIGWLATLTEDGCNYAMLEGPMVTEITTNPDMPFLEVGLSRYREASLIDDTWTIDYNQLCKDYNTDIVNVDGVWIFSKMTSFLALVLAGAAVLLIWFSSCFVFNKNTWKWVGGELLMATVFKLLSYTWLATSICNSNNGQDKCSISYGAKADIVACVMWFTSGVLVLLRYPNPKPDTYSSAVTTTSAVEMPDIT